MKNLLAFGPLVAVVLFSSAIHAQEKRPEFAEMYNKRHAKQKPVVGDTLDEVGLFDAAGKKFSTKNLKGKHTVLVFGCLT